VHQRHLHLEDVMLFNRNAIPLKLSDDEDEDPRKLPPPPPPAPHPAPSPDQPRPGSEIRVVTGLFGVRC
jgi:hypothetical protein